MSAKQAPRPEAANTGRPRRVVAVDFDPRRVWLVEGDLRADGGGIGRLVCGQIPDEVDVTQPAVLGPFLAQQLQRARFKGLPVVMALPRARAVLRRVMLPADTPDIELAGMVRFQVQKDLPFDAAHAVIDLRPGGEATQAGRPVDVAVVNQDALAYHQQVASAGGFKLARLGLSSTSNVHCLRACLDEPVDATTLLVHLSADHVEIDVLDGGGVTFSRSVAAPVAGPAAAGEVLEQVLRVLHSYRAGESGSMVQQVVVAGATGAEDALVAALSGQASLHGARCRKLDAAEAMQIKCEGSSGGGALTAIGLLLAQAQAADFDFLHPRQPAPVRDVARQRLILGSVAAVLALLLIVGLSWWHVGSRRATLRELTARHDALKAENKKVAALAKRMRAVDAWRGEQRPWLDHWAHLSSLLPPAPQVYITAISTRPGGGMQFTVKATTSQAITEVARRLHDAGYDFQPGQVITSHDRFGYPFSADIRLSAPPKLVIDAARLQAPPRPQDDGSAELAQEPPPSERASRRERRRPR